MKKIAVIAIIAFFYSTLGILLSSYLAIPGSVVSPIWPPAGIALAGVLIFGNIGLLGVFIGCFIADFHFFIGHSWLISMINAIGPSIGGTLQAYVGKVALRYFSGTYNIFNNTRSVLTFIIISAFACCIINASLGTSVLVLTGNIAPKDALYAWSTWWIADAVGVITFTSTIMAWYQTWHEKISYAQLLKLSLTWLIILIVGYFTSYSQKDLDFILIPFAIFAAFQFEIRFSTLTGLLISSASLFEAVLGYGFIRNQPTTITITIIQIFVSIVFLTILIIHAILSDRQKAYNNLQLLNTQLEQRVLDRTKDLSESNNQLKYQKNKAMEALEALKQSHARLMQSEKMASLGVLTAGVAHEIKHPLHAMSANMDSIKMNMDHVVQSINQVASDDNIIKDINQINEKTGSLIVATNEGIKRTADIIADLCAYARSDEPEMVMTDLNRNIDSTLNLLSSEIKGNITIEKDYGKIPLLLCHVGKINQVIMNILVNAIHALQTRRNSKIIIKTEIKDNTIILSIKDNGPGIKKEVLDKIFIPFFTTKKSGSGSGLGLFISSNIIKEHNGAISVKSEIDKGTEFIIDLPVRGI